MSTRNLLPLLLLFLALLSCGGEDPVTPPSPPTPTPGDSTLVPDTTGHDTLPEVKPKEFARGADISWYSQMEDEGHKFYSWNQREPMDCPAVIHDLGLNAIALRILVNPQDGYCDTDDVVRKARRVTQLGTDLLVSLHYSDTIASSVLQRTPQEWQGHSISQLLEDVRDHTTWALQSLTSQGIQPRWIQIGNQLSQGLLWPEGDITRHASQYAALVRQACLAARSVCPKAQIIVAAGDPLDHPDLCTALDGVGSTYYDQIGLTLYPTLAVGTLFTPLGTAASRTVENENDAIAYAMQTVDMLYNRRSEERRVGKEC